MLYCEEQWRCILRNVLYGLCGAKELEDVLKNFQILQGTEQGIRVSWDIFQNTTKTSEFFSRNENRLMEND